jgi:hypothetical protein
VSLAAISLCTASQRVLIVVVVVVYFVIDSVRKLLDTPSYSRLPSTFRSHLLHLRPEDMPCRGDKDPRNMASFS